MSDREATRPTDSPLASGWREAEPTVFVRKGDHSRDDSARWNTRPEELIKRAIGSIRPSRGSGHSG
jgi:hypothetical protein